MKNLLYTILISFLLFSCKKDNQKNDDYHYNRELFNLVDTEDLASGTLNYSINEMSIKKPNSDDLKIIKTSNLKFETNSVEKTYLHIKKQVEKLKGFIQKDNTSRVSYRIERSLVVRIPTKNFQVLIDSVSNKIKVFDYKNTLLKDVTEEFVDIEARLKSKKTLEKRYLQLLSKAKNVEEMLVIERELATIREEIEAKEGRLNYLKDQVSFSTINIDFYEPIAVVKSKSNTYFSQVIKAIKGGFNNLGNFVLRILYLWPYILIAIPLILFIRKKIKKRFKK